MTKSRIAAVAGVAFALLGGIYWFVHFRQLRHIDEGLAQASSGLSTAASPEELLAAPGRLAVAIKTASKRPFLFATSYQSRDESAREALVRSPEAIAAWLRGKRAAAWGQLAPGGTVRNQVSDEDFSQTLRELVSIGKTGLSSQERFATAAVEAKLEPGEVVGLADLASEVKQTGELVNKIASVGRAVSPARAESRRIVQQGLRAIDAANRKVDDLAPLTVLRSAVSDWQLAMNKILAATRPLHSLPHYRDRDQVALAEALTSRDRQSISHILEQIGPRVDEAWKKLQIAERQESTPVGSMARGLQRFVRDASQQAANSRIGKELSVVFKTLVLGTKAFYDLMEMGPDDDIFAWASRYEGDMDQLMAETDDMLATDGWSLTGKNTPIEDFVNRAYESSYGHAPSAADLQRASRAGSPRPFRQKGDALTLSEGPTGDLDLHGTPSFAEGGTSGGNVDLRNLTLTLPGLGRTITLVDGEFTDRAAPLFVSVSEQSTVGDLTGDGVGELVALLTVNTGGSGDFRMACVIDVRSGQTVASADLGDRVGVEQLSIDQQTLRVVVVDHGPDDPMCCPSVRATKKFRISGVALVDGNSHAQAAMHTSGNAGTVGSGGEEGRLVFMRGGDVWSIGANGADERLIYGGGDAAQPRYSRGRVAFKKDDQIFVESPTGPTAIPGTQGVLEFDLSPDSDELVLTYRQNRNFDLYTMRLDGSDKRLVNSVGLHQFALNWGMDGYIYLGQAPYGDAHAQRIYRIPKDGTNNAQPIVGYFSQSAAPDPSSGLVVFLYNQPSPRLRTVGINGAREHDVPSSPSGVEGRIDVDGVSGLVFAGFRSQILAMDPRTGRSAVVVSNATADFDFGR